MRWIAVALFLFSSHTVIAGFERSVGGARARALGSAYAALSNDAWAPTCNAGGLAQLHSCEASFFFSPQPFAVTELSSAEAAVAVPTPYGVIGFSGRRYGYDLYREVSGMFSYANTLSGIGIGLSIGYQSVSIARYGSAGTLGIDAGLLAPITDSFRWGFSVQNLNAPAVGASAEKLPQTFTGGIAYLPLPSVALAIDYRKETGSEPSPRFGIECRPVDALALRCGCSGEPSEFSGGFGIRWSLFRLDYAFTSHQDLGWIHEASISMSWGGDRE
jgi:hypothetical protein